MTTYEALSNKFNSIRVSNIARNLQDLVRLAEEQELSYLQFAQALVDSEISARNESRIKLNLKRSRIPRIKTIEEFDFSIQTTISKRQVKGLLDFTWIDNRENVVFLGPSGVGKTHLAIALGVKAIYAGYKAVFYSTIDLLESLDLALAQHQLKERIKSLCKYDLLIIDELGYLPLDRKSICNFFQLINNLYEERSIILTTNKGFPQWGEFFADETSAIPVIDRIIHHSRIFQMNGESYRLKKQLEKESDAGNP